MKTKMNKVLEKYKSRWVLISSIDGVVWDTPNISKGSTFGKSIAKVLLNNNSESLSITDFFFDLRKEIHETVPNYPSVPALGILENSCHGGGEFQFKIKPELLNQNGVEVSQDVLLDDEKSQTVRLESLLSNSLEKLKKELLTEVAEVGKKYEKLESRIIDKEKKVAEEKEKLIIDKKGLLNLLRNAKIDVFFDEIQKIEEQLTDFQSTEILHIESQWRAIENQRRLNILDHDTEYIYKNKLTKSLIEITKEIKKTLPNKVQNGK